MLVIDTPVSLLVGTAMALKSKGSEDAIDNRYRAFLRGLLIQSLIITPMTVLFLVRFPDWEVSYLFDAQSVMSGPTGAWLTMAFIVWLNAFYVIGFKLGEKLIYQSKRQQLRNVVRGLWLIILVITAFVFRETLYLGTTAEYHAGTAAYATTPEFLVTVIIIFPLWFAAFFWAIRAPKAE